MLGVIMGVNSPTEPASFAISFSLCITIIGCFFMIRNIWVYKTRTKILNEDSEIWNVGFNKIKNDKTAIHEYSKKLLYPTYSNLPSYYTMLFLQFWIWDTNTYRMYKTGE